MVLCIIKYILMYYQVYPYVLLNMVLFVSPLVNIFKYFV